jgi:hypothetical protein
MTHAGDPPWAIESLLALAAYQRAGGPTAIVHDTVQEILGRPPRSLAEFVKDHARSFAATKAPRRTTIEQHIDLAHPQS